MKVIVTFKDPDCAQNESAPPAAQKIIDQIKAKYFEYGEYANIEIDTAKGTATLLPIDEM